MKNLKQSYAALIEAYKEDADILEFITDNMSRMENYVNAVYMQEVMIPQILVLYDGEEQRDRLQTLDNTRRIKHDAAVAAVAQLNRLAQQSGIEPMFDGDAEDRYQIANFCIQVVSTFFKNGQPTRFAA